MGRTDFSDKFRKIIICHKRIGYDLNAIRPSACLVVDPVVVGGFAVLFSCTPVDQASDSMMARPAFWLVVTGSFVRCLVHRSSTDDLPLLKISRGVVWQTRDHHLSHGTLCLLSHRLCFVIVFKRDLFVCRGGSLTSWKAVMRAEQTT